MKEKTHPAYYPDAVIKCFCGASYSTGSTVKEMAIEICSACHPFYTGKQKFVDITGQVEKFKRKYSKKSAKK